jgi:hypothetical protein
LALAAVRVLIKSAPKLRRAAFLAEPDELAVLNVQIHIAAAFCRGEVLVLRSVGWVFLFDSSPS